MPLQLGQPGLHRSQQQGCSVRKHRRDGDPSCRSEGEKRLSKRKKPPLPLILQLRGKIYILILEIDSNSQIILLCCYRPSISFGSLLDRSHYWLLFVCSILVVCSPLLRVYVIMTNYRLMAFFSHIVVGNADGWCHYGAAEPGHSSSCKHLG